MQNKKFQLIWIVSVLVATTLACSFLSGITQNVSGVKDTAQAVVTQAQGFVTQAQGLATEAEESGILKTAQAFATQEGGKLAGTVVAMATEAEQSGFLETAQVFATEGFSMGETPTDIPVMDPEQARDFFGSKDVVSYTTENEFQSVLDFYKTQMPENGWNEIPDESSESENVAVLKFEKSDRTATVTLTVNPSDQSTFVMILIVS